MMDIGLTPNYGSAVYAALFGLFFAIALLIAKTIYFFIKAVFRVILYLVNKNGRLDNDEPKTDLRIKNTTKASNLFADIIRGFSVIIYSICFVIFSYYAFDGVIRLFPLFISVSVILIVLNLCSVIFEKFVKKLGFYAFYSAICLNLPLDFNKEK